jgi:hypothetical protein
LECKKKKIKLIELLDFVENYEWKETFEDLIQRRKYNSYSISYIDFRRNYLFFLFRIVFLTLWSRFQTFWLGFLFEHKIILKVCQMAPQENIRRFSFQNIEKLVLPKRT